MKERIEVSIGKVQGIMGKLTTSEKITPDLMKAVSEAMLGSLSAGIKSKAFDGI
ncbi:MAG: hypothetical protein P8P32_15970 [Akkermansiaceae bacterium]|nr:hypothetical protein [Akkermansiaceae bacterium]MDG2322875.1 hypothetical protein [Akkermansiaceae bacterium]